jgi:sulfopyruvate decarboxylase subunit alpha
MLNSTEAIYQGIKSAGIDFIVSVPCINLKELLIKIDKDEEIIHIPVTREEEGLGICAGAYLAGKKIAILMQNSGLGNSINALTSLYELYSFPLVMIISHRGTEGEPIIGQVPMGNVTSDLFSILNISCKQIKTPDEAKEIVGNSWNLSTELKKPIAILADINYW